MKTLVFDLFGDYGHFKKYYTTSSPLTFPFPPIPTIKGMIGAIAGFHREEYLDILSKDNCKISVRIINPINKISMGLNHINTKDNVWIPKTTSSHQPYTQVKVEYLKNPYFRIYLYHEDDEVFNHIYKMIKEHKNCYILSMGISELLADFKFVDIKNFKEKNNKICEISSIVPLGLIKEQGIQFVNGRKYCKEIIPINMTKERIVENYEEILYEENGKTIYANMKCFWEDEKGESIVFF